MLELGDVLKAIGPNASIVFAAWIFMGFLQQRYDSAIDRYRGAVGAYRSGDHSNERRDDLREQIGAYRRRCAAMGRALLSGLAAAMLLIAALLFGALDVIMPHVPVIAWAGTVCAIVGFALVIVSAASCGGSPGWLRASSIANCATCPNSPVTSASAQLGPAMTMRPCVRRSARRAPARPPTPAPAFPQAQAGFHRTGHCLPIAPG